MFDRHKRPEHSYLANTCVKRDGVEIDYTSHEMAEYIRCVQDPIYFAKTYMKVIHVDHGLVDFDLYSYQEKMFEHFENNRFNIILAPRQSGKSIASVAYLLWYAIFHTEKTIAILANKGATAKEMVARITLALENLPFFLQPGCKALNKGSIEFSNNSKIIAASTSSSSIRGLAISMLYLDEFAFVERDNEFYTSTYPVITSGKETKVIISSTPDGVGNMFYKIWSGALKGSNLYKPFRVYWTDVPGRDEDWRKETIANTSEMQFAQEYNCEFIGSSKTLVNSDSLLGLTSNEPIKINKEHTLLIYEKPIAEHLYIMSVDVSKGRGQDYSVFHLIDITSKPYKQVVTFRDNMMSPLLFPTMIVKMAIQYNEAWIIIENNDAGHVVCNGVYYDHEYDNMYMESIVKASGLGLMMTKKVKAIGCSNLKDLIESGKLEINDHQTIKELTTFESRGASFQAHSGSHDDLVMAMVSFAWFVSTEAFGDMSGDDIRKILYADREAEMNDEIMDFGFMTDSTNSTAMNEHENRVTEMQSWQNL